MFTRRSFPVLNTTLAAAISAASPCFAGEARELVIENSPQRIPEGLIKAKLHGVSVVTTSPMFLESTSSGVTIPTEVVVAAVKTAPELRKALNLPDDPEKITFSDIAHATKTSDTTSIIINSNDIGYVRGVYCGIPRGQAEASWENLTCDDSARYNLGAITKLLAFDGLDTSKTITHKVGVNNVGFVAVRPSYADALIAGNEAIDRLKSSNEASGGQVLDKSAWYDLDELVSGKYSENVNKVAFLGDKTVAFGIPYVESSTEAKLKLPKNISDNFDVYLLHLAMTWRDLPHSELDELSYSVILPNEATALALMPLRYGIEVEERTKSQLSPGVEVNGVKVELGELYGREISFSYLKPTIQAYGLQESRFSWSMRDQAVQPGAEQFLCAVGVPKHSKQLNLIMSASAHWSGMFAVAGGIETTDQFLRTIVLQ